MFLFNGGLWPPFFLCQFEKKMRNVLRNGRLNFVHSILNFRTSNYLNFHFLDNKSQI